MTPRGVGGGREREAESGEGEREGEGSGRDGSHSSLGTDSASGIILEGGTL